MLSQPLCPRYHKAVELLGRRWAGAIVMTLLDGPARYAELRTRIPDISDRMLAERLRELESEGVISRTVIPATPVRVEYCLTEKGRALEESVRAIGRWAEEWVEAIGNAAQDTAQNGAHDIGSSATAIGTATVAATRAKQS